MFCGLGLLLGYLATSGAKSDVIFLLGDPISYKGEEISRLSRLVTRSDATTATEGSHAVSVRA